LTFNAEPTAPKKKTPAAGTTQNTIAKAKSNPRKPGSHCCFSLVIEKAGFHMPGKMRGLDAFGD
jgi:hypothetical protein